MDTPDFRTWIDQQYEKLSAEYRVKLNGVVNACRQYAEGNNWLPKHTATGISCFPQRPSLGKYPGIVSEEDQIWFKTCLKPNWDQIKKEAEDQIRKLCPAESGL